MNKDLKSMTFNELEQTVTQLDQKKYLAKYIFNFIHSMNINDISQISSLSKAFRTSLIQQGYYISQLKITQTFTDPDDDTVKYILDLSDGNQIQTVLLFDDGRKTLCVSTQVGCAMNCEFCATAKLGFRRNLTAGEIVDQVYTVQRNKCKISNIVYMGMGEPMNNYDEVLKSVRILNHPDGINLGLRHLTISTCGDLAGIKKLANEDIHPRLAISLNAPTDAIRSKLMPINTRYPLSQLFKTIKLYQFKTKQRVTFEYVLINSLNDSALHAQILAKLLLPLKCNVNLIEYNPHYGSKLAASNKEAIKRFAKILEKAGIETTIRPKRGQKINAACGQLGGDQLGIPPSQPQTD